MPTNNHIDYQGAPRMVYEVSQEVMTKAIEAAEEKNAEKNLLLPFAGTEISTVAAAEILGVCRITMLQYAKDGEIPSSRTNKGNNSHVKFDLAAVLKYKRDKMLSKLNLKSR